VINEGDDQRRLMILTDGLAKMTLNGKFVRLLGEGECFGETGFINGGAQKHRIEALTPIHALELSAEVLTELPPKIHLHYYRHISEILVARSELPDEVDPDISL